MKFREIERHARQIEKIRTELGCGGTPWQFIRRPKGLETKHFRGKIDRLRQHEKDLKRKLQIYMLKNAKR